MARYFILIVTTVIFVNHIFYATTLKSKDIRNYLGTRTPYRYKYNKNDTKIKFSSEYYLKIIVFYKYVQIFSK